MYIWRLTVATKVPRHWESPTLKMPEETSRTAGTAVAPRIEALQRTMEGGHADNICSEGHQQVATFLPLGQNISYIQGYRALKKQDEMSIGNKIRH